MKNAKKKLNFTLISYDPLTDWKKVVYFASLLLAVSLLWSGYVFWCIESGSAFFKSTAAIAPSPVVLNAKSLGQVSDVYSKKAEVFQVYLSAAPAVVDPAK
jgi:hypothetical protein